MGTYLVGASGRALYLWVADPGGKSVCLGSCAKAWPPLTASSMPNVSGGVNAADVSLISRGDGAKQVAYKGHPLYYFIADTRAGMLSGQGSDGFGAKWWLVAPSGNGITTSGSSASASGSSSSSSSGGSSSGGSASGGY
jgi:predicted lipoprotein with Yx(FWY)xxD motif